MDTDKIIFIGLFAETMADFIQHFHCCTDNMLSFGSLQWFISISVHPCLSVVRLVLSHSAPIFEAADRDLAHLSPNLRKRSITKTSNPL